MITVRFPSGFSVQYNDLNTADFRPNGVYLGKKSTPDSYSVWAPLDCMIEHVSPCRTYHAGADDSKREIAELRHKLDLARRQIAKLKAERTSK